MNRRRRFKAKRRRAALDQLTRCRTCGNRRGHRNRVNRLTLWGGECRRCDIPF